MTYPEFAALFCKEDHRAFIVALQTELEKRERTWNNSLILSISEERLDNTIRATAL